MSLGEWTRKFRYCGWSPFTCTGSSNHYFNNPFRPYCSRSASLSHLRTSDSHQIVRYCTAGFPPRPRGSLCIPIFPGEIRCGPNSLVICSAVICRSRGKSKICTWCIGGVPTAMISVCPAPRGDRCTVCTSLPRLQGSDKPPARFDESHMVMTCYPPVRDYPRAHALSNNSSR